MKVGVFCKTVPLAYFGREGFYTWPGFRLFLPHPMEA